MHAHCVIDNDRLPAKVAPFAQFVLIQLRVWIVFRMRVAANERAKFLGRHDSHGRHDERDAERETGEDRAEFGVEALPTFAPYSRFLAIGARAGAQATQARNLYRDAAANDRTPLASPKKAEHSGLHSSGPLRRFRPLRRSPPRPGMSESTAQFARAVMRSGVGIAIGFFRAHNPVHKTPGRIPVARSRRAASPGRSACCQLR